jgi:SAM-dependent methyltransferase
VTGALHWNDRYASTGPDAVSWFEPTPATSLALLGAMRTRVGASVIDIGGGASSLSEMLVAEGYAAVSVLDLSRVALDAARERVGDGAPITWIEADVRTWKPERTWDLWHDRAVLHFLTDDTDRAAYLSQLRNAISPGGGFVIGTFAEDGPEECSALPVRRHSIEDLVALVPDAEVIETRRQIHSTPGGKEQPFNWIAARLP